MLLKICIVLSICMRDEEGCQLPYKTSRTDQESFRMDAAASPVCKTQKLHVLTRPWLMVMHS